MCVVWSGQLQWQVVIAMSPFLTSKENIVVNLIYEWLGESRINRTYDEYMEIASRFPKVAACHAYHAGRPLPFHSANPGGPRPGLTCGGC